MKTVLLLLFGFLLFSPSQAQDYRSHIIFHLKYENGYLTDTVSQRQWGPYENTSPIPNRYGQAGGFYFNGGNPVRNHVALKNLNLKPVPYRGFTVVAWQGYEIKDSARFGLAFYDSISYGATCRRTGAYQEYERIDYKPCMTGSLNPMVDSLMAKNRFKKNRWNFFYYSLSGTSLAVGINDTLWTATPAQILHGCFEIPLGGQVERLDFIEQIHLNSPTFNINVGPPPCEPWSGYPLDKFRFYEDVIVFDTAYQPADFAALYNFPQAPTQLVANKATLRSLPLAWYRYDAERTELTFLQPEGEPPLKRAGLYDLQGRCVLQPSPKENQSLVHLPPSLYLLRLETEGGEVFVGKVVRD